jgi:hypothetical protein
MRVQQSCPPVVKTVEQGDAANPHFTLTVVNAVNGTDICEVFDVLEVRVKKSGGVSVLVKLDQLVA